MPFTASELAAVADEISQRVGFVDVEVAGLGGGSAHRCADMLAAQQAGLDPTAGWRKQVGENQRAYYGVPAPPQVGAAFVLQWYLGVIAVPLAWAAVLGPWVLDGAPAALSFDLSEPDGFPIAISIRPDKVEVITDEPARLLRAHERYLAHARAFADSYRPPEVRMGSGQRNGHVHDAWSMALQDAQAATLPAGVEPLPPSRRRGCCMIYALPGAQECTACPRGVRRTVSL